MPKHPPTRILLGTDLSPSGDRALDRAAQLTRQWGVQLVIVHAIERGTSRYSEVEFVPSWRKSADPTMAIQNRIRRDLREAVDYLKIVIKEGSPAEAIMETAADEGCDLIILGASRGDSSGVTFFGNTAEYLIRKSPVSVLVVKTRPNGEYRNVLVGTDFTDESRHGLEVAAASFPDSRLTVMHAFEMPYRAFLSDTTLGHDFAAMERTSIQQFVAESDLPPQARPKVSTLIEHGPPSLMMRRFVEEQNADLTVIGAYGRGFLFHLLGGGNTPHIVDAVSSDVLLVRAHRPEP